MTPSTDPEISSLRHRLVDAAFDAFVTKGFFATSIHDLKRLTGVSGGAFAHHFPSKKALAIAVLSERVGQAVTETWIAPVLAAPSLHAGVAQVFAGLIAELDARGAVSGCPLNALASEITRHDPLYAEAISGLFADWRAALATKIREDQRGGRFPGQNPEDLASFVIAAYSGAMAMAKAEQSTQPLKACAALLHQALSAF